jgi:hypothetical protein
MRFAPLARIFSHIPVVGGLPQTTRENHMSALRETLISLAISAAPIWGGAFALFYVKRASNAATYYECIRSIVENGELFIYAAAAVAPVIYIVTRDRIEVRSFPSKTSFILATIFFAVVSAIVFTIERIGQQILTSDMIDLSIILYCLAIVIYYLALVYNNNLLPDPATAMRSEESDFFNRFRKHRP